MELSDLNLEENPFRTGPSINPGDLLWAGFPELKGKIEQRINFSIKTSPSRIVLNWGRYGSGKTHAANFYTKTSRITELSTQIGASETKSIKINLPRTSRDPVQSFLRSFLGQISLQNIQADFAALIKLEDAGFMNQILSASSNDSVITELFKLIIENEDPGEFSSLEAYIFGDSTKGTLGKLGLPSGLKDDEQIVNFISTYINCITYEKKLYPAFILWLDEFEDIDTLNKASQDRVTTFLRQLFDKTPNNFLLFLNFTPKTFYNIEDLSITLGEALTTRAKLRISFEQPSSDEARTYIQELIRPFLTVATSEFGPFSSEAVDFILSHIGSLSVRKINEVFSFIIEMAIMADTSTITPEFVESIRDEIVYYED
jgi:hypothetical protein